VIASVKSLEKISSDGYKFFPSRRKIMKAVPWSLVQVTLNEIAGANDY